MGDKKKSEKKIKKLLTLVALGTNIFS